MTRPSRALAAVVAGAALATASIAPASAADWVHDDAVGDVQTVTYDETTTEEPDLVTAPDNVTTDVTQLAIRHRAHRVALRLRLRDITARSGVAVFQIRTDDRSYLAFKQLGSDGSFLPRGWFLMRGNGRQVRCDDARRDVDRAAELMVARIPRSCLGFPQWVRVAAGVQSVADDVDSLSFWLDDGLRDGDVRDRLAMSPRVYRD